VRRATRLRHKAAEALLYVAAVVFAVWFGGQVFNALMVVPVWSASPPDSVVAYNSALNQYGHGRLPFFVIFNPLWVTLLLGASLLLGRGGGRERRVWVVGFALWSAAATLAVLGWMAPTVGRTMRAMMDGSHTPADLAAMSLWVRANWARLGLEMCGLLCALRATGAAPRGEADAPAAGRAREGAAPAAAVGRA
jgi:hypothetical protein